MSVYIYFIKINKKITPRRFTENVAAVVVDESHTLEMGTGKRHIKIPVVLSFLPKIFPDERNTFSVEIDFDELPSRIFSYALQHLQKLLGFSGEGFLPLQSLAVFASISNLKYTTRDFTSFNNIHEKVMQSDWLREMQFFGNTVQKRGN